MNTTLRILHEDKSCFWGTVYVALFVLVTAIINYFTWSPSLVSEFNPYQFLFWSLLYLPLLIFNKRNGWSIRDFGFGWNKKVALVTVGLILLLGVTGYKAGLQVLFFDQWRSSAIEAFARTGEELLFRGFVYSLALRLFKDRNRPHWWAIIISSILFALPHTQIFLPEHNTSIFQIFLLAVFFAYLRYKLNSSLPGIIIHVFLQTTNLLGMLFGWFIYMIFVLRSYRQLDD